MRPEELDVCLEIKILPRYDQSNVTAQMTQPLWESMLEDLGDLEIGSNPFVRLNFAHKTTMMPLLRALGLYRDKQMKASDWPARERRWKSSQIVTFASNIAVFMLSCDPSSTTQSEWEEALRKNSTGDLDPIEEEDSTEYASEKIVELTQASSVHNQTGAMANDPIWQVLVLHQERPVAIEACGGNILCPLDTFTQV